MKTYSVYHDHELSKGICPSCGEESSEILNDDGRCLDCIESEKFYEETMKQNHHEK